MNSDQASIVALRALEYIVADATSLDRLMRETGLDSATLMAEARNPEFLGGVLDHLLANEATLLGFCEASELAPETPALARRALPGGTAEV